MKNRNHFTYTRPSVLRKGLLDGRNYMFSVWPFRRPKQPYPLPTQTTTPQFEQELTDAANTDLQGLAQEWKEADETLLATYETAAATLAIVRPQASSAKAAADSAGEFFHKIRKQITDYPAPALNPLWMHIWLVFIGISEFLFNSVAFEIFGQRKLETFVIAAGVGVALPVVAHYIGQTLRQEHRTRRDTIFMGFWAAVVVTSIVMLSIIREKFFEAQDVHQILGISLSPGESSLVFITLNLLLFGTGLLVSFQGSYKDQAGYNTLRKQFREARRNYRALSATATEAQRRAEAAERDRIAAHTRREKRFEQFTEQASRIVRNNDWFIRVYRTANMESRSDSVTPECFLKTPVVAAIPQALTELEWPDEPHVKKPVVDASDVALQNGNGSVKLLGMKDGQ